MKVKKMVKGLLGKKLNMSLGFDSHSRAVPITNVLVEPNYIVQIKSDETDGYKAVQIASGSAKKLTKQLEGHVKKAGVEKNLKVLKEIRFDGELKLGQELRLGDVFSKGNLVDVVGISKGKGFAGVVKRHGFAGGPRTHGQSDRERAGGSIGATTTPGRVYKGTKMAGHMGAEKVRVQGLEILVVDKESNTVGLKGSIPGPTGSWVLVEKSKKSKKRYHEPELPAVPHLGGKDENEQAEEKVDGAATIKEVVEKTEGVAAEERGVSEGRN